MRSRIRLGILFALPLLSCISATRAQGPPGRFHRPPWDAPVVATHSIEIGGATIRIDFGSEPGALSQDAIVQWVRTAATAVSTYYGQFPVRSVRVLVLIAPDRSGILRGTTWGGVGGVQAFSRMVLGANTTQQQLNDDWTMTHEFVHTAFPSLPDENHWMEEGLATYVEPIARVQAGFLKPERIWADMVRDMPKGEPAPGDEGLDRTHTWGRTYWGGAMFCLAADVAIRRKTGDHKGLQDALRAIVNAGGTIDKDWDLPRALAIGDQATGTTVLTDLYRSWSTTPVSFDLNRLWQQLGISVVEGSAVFDNHAPLAEVRRGITQPAKSTLAAWGMMPRSYPIASNRRIASLPSSP